MFKSMNKVPEVPAVVEEPLHALEDPGLVERVLESVEGLSPEKAECVALRMQGMKVTEVARQTRVPIKRLRRWEATDTAYITALQYASGELISGSIHAMRQGLYEAVELLRDIMSDGSLSPNTRMRAASTLLKSVVKLPSNQPGAGGAKEADENERMREMMKKIAKDPDALELTLALREITG